jgi:iron(III) transport system permease protein
MSKRVNKMALAGTLLILTGVSMPLIYLVIRATESGGAELYELVARPRNLELLKNTTLLLVGVWTFSLFLAFPLAWLTSRTDLKGKRAWALVGILPLAIPSYLMAYALQSMGGQVGMIAEFTNWVLPRINGYWGAVLILGFCNFPYLFFNLRTSLMHMDPALEEAAHSLGLNHRQIVLRVFLPQLKPALFSGSLLVALHVIGDFAAVSLMRFETLSYVLYTQYLSAYNRSYAAAIALILIMFTVLLLVIEGWFLRRIRFDRASMATNRSAKSAKLGAWSPVAYGYLSTVLLVSVIAPVSTMIFWALKANVGELWPDMKSALIGSTFASLPAAVLTTVLIIPVVYLSVRTPSRLTRFLERSTYFGYSIPALAFALGLVFFSLKLVPGLYQTLFLLIYAYTMHYMAEALGPVRSAMYQTSPRMEEAARSLGYGRITAMFKTTIPLIRNGMLISMAFVFLSCMKELHLTLILSPLGYNTLALNVWSHIEEAMFANAAPYALAILAFSGLFVGLILVQERQTA